MPFVVVLLLLRVFNFLIFKWAKMARRERGLREALRDLGADAAG